MAKDMRVVVMASIGLISVVLAILVHWTFWGVAALTQILGWNRLMKKK